MRDHRRGRIPASLDAYLYVSTLQFKLGDILFDQEVDKLFQLFLIHERIRFSSAPACATAASYRAPTELKCYQVLGGRRQDFMSRFGNQDHIFDSDSTFFRNVDARLDNDDHSRRKFLGLASGQSRRLMHLNSHSVAGGMGKKSVESSFFQYFTPGTIHFAGFRPRPHSSE